jgi:hypothetical protein
MVMQRVQARVAGEELTAQYDDPPPRPQEPATPAPPRIDPAPETAEVFPGATARRL